MVSDFTNRLLSDLLKRRQSYVDKLISAAAVDHDRLAGTIKAYDDIVAAIKAEARAFLVTEEAA